MTGLLDTHAHLDDFARRGELKAVLARARAAGVEAVIAIGTAPDDWDLYRGIAGQHSGTIHYTVGIHPCSVDEKWEDAAARIERFWSPPQSAIVPLALGECGLDRFHLPKEPEAAQKIFLRQKAAFAAQLALVRRLGCPLVVHSRLAFKECVEMIDASGVDWGRVVFHCFSEGEAEAAELRRRSARASFTGILTYKNAEGVRAAARAQGLARLMIETDAPYLAPVPHRGKPNEPAYLRNTAEFAAGLFNVPYEELAAVTTRNAREFFNLKGSA